MKKKLLLALSTTVCALICAFGIVACAPQIVGGSQATVTLQANGGAFTDGRTAASITVDIDSSIDGLTPYPVKDGYVFDGWAENANGTELWDLSEKKVAKNITLYAVWGEKVTVTYFANGGVFEDESESIEVGIKKDSKPKLPDEPNRDGYVFGGWYTGTVDGGSVTLGTGFDTNTTVTEDVTVYAKWTYETGKPLPAPASVTVVNNKISWSTVDGANGYRVIILDAEDNELTSTSVDGSSYSYNFALRGEESYKVRVRAKGDGINYTNSAYATSNYTYKLTAVDISFDVSSSELAWEIRDDDMAAATSYDFELYEYGNADPIYSDEEVETTSFDMSSYDAGSYTVKIVSNKNNFTSVTNTLTFTKLRLATPNLTTAIEEKDGEFSKVTLSWDAVKNATSYIITVGQYSVRTTNLTYTIENDDFGGQPGPVDPNPGPVDPVTRAVGGAARADFASADGVVAVRAFDANYDYLVSLPAESIYKKSALVKIEVTNDSTASGSTEVNGSLYKYNEPPYNLYFDYFTNLYIRYPEMVGKSYYDYYVSSSSRISDSFSFDGAMYYTKRKEVAAENRIEYPDPIDRPAVIPQLSGYTYICNGWYADKECTRLFDFTASIAQDTRVYAGWVCLNEYVHRDRIYSAEATISCGIYRNDFTDSKQSQMSTRRGTFAANASTTNVYFTTTVAHRYDLKLENAQSGSAYENTVTIYNVTTDKQITTLVVNSTTAKIYSFNGKAGDVFRITFSHTGSTACALDYVMGHDNNQSGVISLPTCGKAGEPNYSAVGSVASGTVYAVKGSVVTLTAKPVDGKTFVGWFDANNNKVSGNAVFTFTANAEGKYTAKWE